MGRPLPDDFAEVARTMGRRALRARYHVSSDVLMEWFTAIGGNPRADAFGQAGKFRAVPADFIETAKAMYRRELLKHYNVSWPVLHRWIAETGVETKAPPPPPIPTKKNKPRKQNFKFNGHPGGQIKHEDMRPKSVFNDAADIIRRYCPVSRCDENGVYAEAGDFWRVGQVVVTPDELLERAERRRAA